LVASIADALLGTLFNEETLTKIVREGVVKPGLPDAQMPALRQWIVQVRPKFLDESPQSKLSNLK
jgi:hypothetical protein